MKTSVDILVDNTSSEWYIWRMVIGGSFVFTIYCRIKILKKTPLFVSVLFVLTVSLLFSQSADLDVEQFMPVDEVQSGMKGYGLTVFSGTEVDTFGVEVLGVLEKVRPKGDIILARLSGGPLEETGIAAGMSGSPIYIDGRLIGAVAYAWLFAKEPIAGVTPIGEMLDLWTLSSEPRGRRKTGSLGLGVPSEQDRTLSEHIPIPKDLLGGIGRSTSPSGAFLRQLGAPVALAGFDDRVVELMAPVFERFGLIPVQGGASSEETGKPSLEPGSTVSAQLIRGDVSISVVGTVTHLQGDRVLAFGHPVFYAGTIDLPMTGGVVHTVFPSRYRSFKMVSATHSVGSFKQDRRTGVAGQIGPTSKLIPFDIEIKRHDWATPQRYHYELADDLLFTPTLVGWTTANSLLTTERLVGKSSVRIQTTIALKNYAPVTLENFYSGDLTWLMVASSVAFPVTQLMDNPFEKVNIEGITLTLWSEEQLRAATIEGIRIDKLTVRPGDPLELTIMIRPYLGDTISKKVVLTIPENAPDGLLNVIAADAKTIKALEKARAPLKYRPESLSQLIELLQQRQPNNEVVVMVYRSIHGITVKGEELPSLPTSLLSVMTSSKERGQTGPTKGVTLSKERVLTDYFITGSQTLSFRVDRKGR